MSGSREKRAHRGWDENYDLNGAHLPKTCPVCKLPTNGRLNTPKGILYSHRKKFTVNNGKYASPLKTQRKVYCIEATGEKWQSV